MTPNCWLASSDGLGVGGDAGVEEDAGFVAQGPGVMSGFDDHDVAGSDVHLG